MTSEAVTLFRVYDVIASIEASRVQDPGETTGPNVRLHGVVTDTRRGGSSRRFLDLLDPTGSLQLTADREILGEVAWENVKKLQKGSRIYVEGIPAGTSRTGQAMVALTAEPTLASLPDGPLAEASPNYKRVGSRLFAARIMRVVEDALERLGYVRIHSHLISVTWPSKTDLAPLRVVYPGFGPPVYLAPSPAPQLIETLIATGENRVFAATHSFATSYRTSIDGAEAALIMGRTLGIGLDELIEQALIVLNCVRHELRLEDYPLVPMVNSYDSADTAKDPGSVETYDFSPSGKHSVMGFRLFETGQVAPIEGSVEGTNGGLPLGSLSIYPERLLPIVEHLPLRRLQHLSQMDV